MIDVTEVPFTVRIDKKAKKDTVLYCIKNDYPLKEWTEQVLIEAVKNKVVLKKGLEHDK